MITRPGTVRAEKVIDSNLLESQDLREFLVKSKNNFAVLTDYVGLEASSGSTLVLPQRMSVLKDFPSQVIVLKATKQLHSIHPRQAGLRRRLIDEEQTRNFGQFIRRLSRASQSAAIRQQMSELQRSANVIKESLRTFANGYKTGLRELSTIYSPTELSALRSTGMFPEVATDKVQKIIADTCFAMLHSLGVRRPKTESELFNLYAFRHSLCWHLLEIERLAHGSVSVKPEDHANDIADLHIVTCATYFDGLLSRDQKSQRVYWRAGRVLQQLTNFGAERCRGI